MPYEIENATLSRLQLKAARLAAEIKMTYGNQKQLSLLKYAKAAIEEAIRIEGLHFRGFGGHRADSRMRFVSITRRYGLNPKRANALTTSRRVA